MHGLDYNASNQTLGETLNGGWSVETITADFIREAFALVNTWNSTPGNHDIKSLAWFVHNADYRGWEIYSLEW